MGGSAGEGWSKDMAWVFNDLKDAKEDLLVVYGVTDHGGAPTKVAIEEIIKNNTAVGCLINSTDDIIDATVNNKNMLICQG